MPRIFHPPQTPDRATLEGETPMAPADGRRPPSEPPEKPTKRHETIAFLFLSIVLFPLMSIILVGGFGFIIWMQHLLLGPPGSH